LTIQVAGFGGNGQGALAELCRPGGTVGVKVGLGEAGQDPPFRGVVTQPPGRVKSGVEGGEEVGEMPLVVENGSQRGGEFPGDNVVADCCGLPDCWDQVGALAFSPVLCLAVGRARQSGF
jgi:hypothetical protein